MERVKKTLHFPMDIAKRIEKFQKENYISSFTAAVMVLIQKGLDKGDEK